MQAEGYLLCDDTPSCNLELKDVEAILGVARCVRLRENKREAVQKHAKLNAEISTMDIVLRESSESTHILGASPSLTHLAIALYGLPGNPSNILPNSIPGTAFKIKSTPGIHRVPGPYVFIGMEKLCNPMN